MTSQTRCWLAYMPQALQSHIPRCQKILGNFIQLRSHEMNRAMSLPLLNLTRLKYFPFINSSKFFLLSKLLLFISKITGWSFLSWHLRTINSFCNLKTRQLFIFFVSRFKPSNSYRQLIFQVFLDKYQLNFQNQASMTNEWVISHFVLAFCQ